ncbi:MAG: HlyD family efflux transporter periplasmic adaptor subunit [bacterium]|nr:HlyD family efflux transporter periplasmic adaptor subunit [bacterium]
MTPRSKCHATTRQAPSILLLVLPLVLGATPARHDTISGVLIPLASVDLVARADAHVVALTTALGDRVRPGHVIARLDSPSLRHELAAARARRRVAAAQASLAAIGVERHAALRARRTAVADVWSAEEVEAAELDWRAAVAAHTAAVAAAAVDSAICARLEEDHAALTVRAPFAGRLTAIAVEEYELVSAGALIARITDDGAFRVKLATPTERLAEWRPGRGVSIACQSGQFLGVGQVLQVSGEIDRDSGLVFMEATCRVEHDARDLAVAGLPVRVSLE